MSSISAGTTSTTTLVHSGDTTGSLVFKTNDTGSGGTTAVTLDTNQNATFAGKVTSAGALTLASNGTTTAVTIDTSQRTGFGTTSPNEKLVVNGAIRSTNNAVSATATADSGLFYFVPTADAPSDPRTMVQGVGTASVGASIAFLTGTSSSNTERMRINSSGQAIVGATSLTAGTTTANCLITVGGTASPMMKWQSTTGPHAWDLYTSGGAAFYFGYDTSDKATINSSTGAYTALSDRTKKKDFEDSSLGLNAVLQLKPTLYRMLDDADDAPKELGFIAQDVKDVIPQAYVETTGQNGTFIGLNFNPIVATLTKAIQELKAINDQQAETINALTARVVALEGQ